VRARFARRFDVSAEKTSVQNLNFGGTRGLGIEVLVHKPAGRRAKSDGRRILLRVERKKGQDIGRGCWSSKAGGKGMVGGVTMGLVSGDEGRVFSAARND
jgi:hypothetical protein